jgi:outer membrane protein TolC
VLSEAALNYLEWSYYVAQYQVLADAILRTEDQFKIIKNSYEQGDLPAIDTLKSFILLQDYQIQQNDLILYLQKMRYQINNFLWTKDSLPLQIAETVNPQNLKEIFINTPDSNTLQFFLGILDQHPDLQNIQFQKDILDWERKFKNTKLLPKLDLKYNFLSTDQFQFFTPYGFQSFTENYKLGFKFQYPILIRKERADIILNQIKIKETNLKYQQKKYELENKYKSLFNELNILNKQSSQYNILTSNYATLAEAEKLKFSLGESDLLLVTTRDLQLLEAQLKLLKNSFKRSETLIKWLSSTAQFYQN